MARVALRFPQIIDYYILHKERNGDLATATSTEKVRDSTQLYVRQFGQLVELLSIGTSFYGIDGDTRDEARQRIGFLKDVIENQGGHRIFYQKGQPIRSEADLQILFRLTWFSTPSDISREVNDGRGPVDFKVSRGGSDKTLVEMKLASNSQLRRNLENQVEVYKRASGTKKALKAILFFTEDEERKVRRTLTDLNLTNDPDVVLIDARMDNKPSGSKA